MPLLCFAVLWTGRGGYLGSPWPLIPMTLFDVVAVGLTLYILWKLLQNRKPSSHYLPPGPKGLPFVGVSISSTFTLQILIIVSLQNLLDMPPTEEWITFAEWGRKWGTHCSPTVPFFAYYGASRRHIGGVYPGQNYGHRKLSAHHGRARQEGRNIF